MKVIVTNDTDKFMHVGPVTIPPHDSREVEETYLPDYRAKAPSGEVVKIDRIAEIAALNVKAIVAVLKDMSEEELARLLELEQAGQNRKGVTEAVAARQLELAQQKTANTANPLTELADKTLEEILPLIAEMPAEDLTRLAEIEQAGAAREELIAAIAARQLALSGQGNE